MVGPLPGQPYGKANLIATSDKGATSLSWLRSGASAWRDVRHWPYQEPPSRSKGLWGEESAGE